MATKTKAEEIYTVVSSIIGLRAWSVKKLYGLTTVIDFGEATHNKLGRVVGERRLFIQNFYRIETGNEVVATSLGTDANPIYLEAIMEIENKRLETITILEPSLDTVFTFEDKLKVFVYNGYFEGDDISAAWRFVYPVNNVLEIGPGPNYLIDSYDGR